MPTHLPLLVERCIRFGLHQVAQLFLLEPIARQGLRFMLGVLVLVLSLQARCLTRLDNLPIGQALHRQLLERKQLHLRTLRFGVGLRAALAQLILIRQRHQAFQVAYHLAIKQGKS